LLGSYPLFSLNGVKETLISVKMAFQCVKMALKWHLQVHQPKMARRVGLSPLSCLLKVVYCSTKILLDAFVTEIMKLSHHQI